MATATSGTTVIGTYAKITELVRLLNTGGDPDAILRDVAAHMQEWSGCEAVGIRLRQGADYPYFETRGFPEAFVRLESSLCSRDVEGNPLLDAEGRTRLDCMCGSVLRSRYDASLPFFTERGSFWTNSTTALLAGTSQADRQTPTRNRCNGQGYESVALVPLRFGATTYGLLQFNDQRPDRFTEEHLAFLECLAENVALALTRVEEQAAFIQSEEQFRTLADAIPQLCWMARADGWIFWFNRRWYEYTGTTPAQVKGWDWRSVHDPEALPRVLEEWKASIATGRPFETVFSLRGRDGLFRPFLTRVMPVCDQEGRVVRWCGTNTDITERERAEGELRVREGQLRLFAEHAPAAIAMLDSDMRYLAVSDRWLGDYGQVREQVLGRCHYDVFPEIPECWKEIHRRCLAGSVERADEDRFERADGGVKWLRWEIRPWYAASDTVGGIIIFSEDITAQKRAAEALRAAKIAAEKANQAKSAFLAVMSHEIRTPMNGVLGMTELALLQDIPPRVREFLLLVKRSGKALLDIINDILDLSKIESGHAALANEPFALRESLEELYPPLAESAEKKGLAFRHSVAPYVPDLLLGDLGRLRQVLTNLIGNAVKFTENGGVRVSVGMASRSDGGDGGDGGDGDGGPGADGEHDETGSPATHRLLFTVADDGIGIAGERQAEVFDQFSQAGLSSHAKYGGTGLGLSISKSLVELMGGAIWLRSEPGRGSTFCFTAAFGRVEARRGPRLPEPSERVEPEAGRSRAGLRILLAEDNPINQALAVEFLTLHNHRVEVAENGREAIEKLKAGVFDLLLMDVRMPVMDGPAAVEAIRRGEAGRDKAALPIVAMIAHALKGDRERFRAGGMDDYLAKPIDLDELKAVLTRVMADRGREGAGPREDAPG